MSRFTILLSCLLTISGKIINEPDNTDFNDFNDIEDNSSEYYYYDFPANSYQDGDVWFLNLKDDWNSLKLKTASKEQVEEFYSLNGFLINEHKLHQVVQKMLRFFKPRKDNVNVANSNNNETEKKYNLVEAQQHLWQIINKIMIHDDEPGIDLTDSIDSEVQMELFFRGSYCALIVTMKRNQWNFFIPPPSLLSTWFAEVHTDTRTEIKSLELPDNIKEQLFRHLMKLLLLSYSYPN